MPVVLAIKSLIPHSSVVIGGGVGVQCSITDCCVIEPVVFACNAVTPTATL
jgi:hypothetical protein